MSSPANFHYKTPWWERHESVVRSQLDAAVSGGGGGGSSQSVATFIFDPNNTRTDDGVYHTWSDLMTASSLVSGKKTVEFLYSVQIPAGTHVFPDGVEFACASADLQYIGVELVDGAVVQNLFALSGTIQVISTSTSPCLTYSSTASNLIELGIGTSLSAQVGTPMIDVSSGLFVVMLNEYSSLIGPVISASGSSEISVLIESGAYLTQDTFVQLDPAQIVIHTVDAGAEVPTTFTGVQSQPYLLILDDSDLVKYSPSGSGYFPGTVQTVKAALDYVDLNLTASPPSSSGYLYNPATLTADVKIFVDANAGSDDVGDGDIVPFKTVGKALSKIQPYTPAIDGFSITIKVLDFPGGINGGDSLSFNANDFPSRNDGLRWLFIVGPYFEGNSGSTRFDPDTTSVLKVSSAIFGNFGTTDGNAVFVCDAANYQGQMYCRMLRGGSDKMIVGTGNGSDADANVYLDSGAAFQLYSYTIRTPSVQVEGPVRMDLGSGVQVSLFNFSGALVSNSTGGAFSGCLFAVGANEGGVVASNVIFSGCRFNKSDVGLLPAIRLNDCKLLACANGDFGDNIGSRIQLDGACVLSGCTLNFSTGSTTGLIVKGSTTVLEHAQFGDCTNAIYIDGGHVDFGKVVSFDVVSSTAKVKITGNGSINFDGFVGSKFQTAGNFELQIINGSATAIDQYFSVGSNFTLRVGTTDFTWAPGAGDYTDSGSSTPRLAIAQRDPE